MDDQYSDFYLGFYELFQGRRTARGTEDGGCVREPVPIESFIKHLDGHQGLGIYPMEMRDNEWVVRWGCVDLDVKAPHKRRWDYETSEDAWVAALNLQSVLDALDITAWIENTKSGGFHVWIFAGSWVPAAVMRRCLLVACSVADVPPTEVNPKNEGFDSPDTLGNYVRLPYFGAADGRINRPVLDPLTRIPYGWLEFVDEAMHGRARLETISAVADLWRPPAPTAPVVPSRRDYHVPAGVMSRRLQAVVENGPLRQEDRSGWLYYVARLCADDGLPMGEACAIVSLCDDLHTHKFTGRNDGPTRIARTVEKAYQ